MQFNNSSLLHNNTLNKSVVGEVPACVDNAFAEKLRRGREALQAKANQVMVFENELREMGTKCKTDYENLRRQQERLASTVKSVQQSEQDSHELDAQKTEAAAALIRKRQLLDETNYRREQKLANLVLLKENVAKQEKVLQHLSVNKQSLSHFVQPVAILEFALALKISTQPDHLILHFRDETSKRECDVTLFLTAHECKVVSVSECGVSDMNTTQLTLLLDQNPELSQFVIAVQSMFQNE